MINTTNGPQRIDPPAHHVNTSCVVEEDLQYVDEEPEILAVLPANGWAAVVGDDVLPLVAFVALDSGRMYGVPLDKAGRVDLVENDVEKRSGFAGYRQVNSNNKETENG